MPKSRRDKVVALTKVKKKGRDAKEKAIGAIREEVANADAVYVLRYSHMKNAKLKEVRDTLAGQARLFFAANGVMAAALGRDEESEARPGLAAVAERLRGWCGLAIGSATKEQLEEVFEMNEEPVFAKVGSTAGRTVVVEAGPLEGYAHDMEPQLRKEGLPCRLVRGVVEVTARHVVCTEGEPIGAKEGRLLRLLGEELGTFKMWVEAEWREGKELVEHAEVPDEVAALPAKAALGLSVAADDGLDDGLPAHMGLPAGYGGDLPPDDGMEELSDDE